MSDRESRLEQMGLSSYEDKDDRSWRHQVWSTGTLSRASFCAAAQPAIHVQPYVAVSDAIAGIAHTLSVQVQPVFPGWADTKPSAFADAFVKFVRSLSAQPAEGWLESNIAIRTLENILPPRSTTVARERPTTELLGSLERARNLISADYEEAAIDLIHEAVDDLLQRGHFGSVDSLLLEADPIEEHPDILLSLLTTTVPAKEHLRARDRFAVAVKKAFIARNLDEPNLFVGLD